MRHAMAILDDALTPVGESATAPHGRRWPRVAAGFAVGAAIGFALCLGLAVRRPAGLGCPVRRPHPVGGRRRRRGRLRDGSRPGAAALETAFADYGEGQVVVQTSARDVVVPYSASRASRRDAMVAAAMQVGRSGTIDRARDRRGPAGAPASPGARVVLDPAALTSRSAGRALDRPPSTARSQGTARRSRDAGAARPDVRWRGGGRGRARGRSGGRAHRSRRRAPPMEIPPAYGDAEATRRSGRGPADGRGPRSRSAAEVDDPGGARSAAGSLRDDATGRRRRWSTRRHPAVPQEHREDGQASAGLRHVPQDPQRADRGGRGGEERPQARYGATAAAIATALAAARGPPPARSRSSVGHVAPKFTTAQAVKRGPLMAGSGPGRRGSRSASATTSGRTSGARRRSSTGRCCARSEVRVVERARSGHVGARLRTWRVHRRRPHRADRRARRRDVLEFHDPVQRRAPGRPADGRALQP